MFKKKIICIISPSHWKQNLGGAEYQIKNIIDRLRKIDELEIIYLTYSNIINKKDDYKIYQISKKNPLKKYGFYFDSFNLFVKLVKLRPDFIYQRVGSSHTGISLLYSKLFKCKLLYHISHDQELKKYSKLAPIRSRTDKFVLDVAIKRIKYIIAQTNYQAFLLKKNYNKEPFKIVKNFHNIDNIKANKNKNIKIIWIANLKKWKQPEKFIDLANYFEKCDTAIKFIMIGAPAYHDIEWQKKLQNRINNTRNVEYMGKLSIEEVNHHLEKSHILINTSLYEGFSNTFIQAWLREVPVISLFADPDNILEKYRIGFRVATIENAAKMIKKLISNKKILKEMGIRAKEYAVKNHSLRNIEKIVEILEMQ
jgi:glycosyltransferase involved in cell wall biosynthesis